MKKTGVFKLIIFILICQAVGIIGSVFTIPAISAWWVDLTKPWFTPPGWLISIVWVILYTLMGISLFWIWNKGIESREIKKAVGVFAVQLFLNAIWSPVFFGLKNLFLGLALGQKCYFS